MISLASIKKGVIWIWFLWLLIADRFRCDFNIPFLDFQRRFEIVGEIRFIFIIPCLTACWLNYVSAFRHSCKIFFEILKKKTFHSCNCHFYFTTPFITNIIQNYYKNQKPKQIHRIFFFLLFLHELNTRTTIL